MIIITGNGEDRVLTDDELELILTCLEQDGGIDSAALYEQLRELVGVD